MSLIELKNLSVRYGPITAVEKLNASFEKGAITCILGANGAGKSTTLKCLAGLIPPSDGQIIFDGNDVSRSSAHDMVAHGLALAPEGRRLFPGLSVFENLRLGAYTTRDRQTWKESLERVYSYFPRVHERRNQLAGSLSGGEQQMVAIGRALMSRPKVLLLDEPSLGLAPKIIIDMAKIVREINTAGITVVIVEQNARLALRLSSYGYVLDTGRLVSEGTSETLLNDDQIKNAYLGKTGAS
ncbi:ABC transporter ATP-binding protein [Pollutimonas sp. H1-120]|uniref:ABC transporter ATP-binding protein n=1 Tax=Pollutimonas sp. H1-120 TaxID=3148824 RepID=UPI003B528E12